MRPRPSGCPRAACPGRIRVNTFPTMRIVAQRVGEAAVVATGRFGADMAVSLRNDGPVTIIMDSKNRE
jgi:hypothetical protein